MFTHYFLLCSNSIKAATLFFGVVDKIQIKSPLYGYKENAISLSHMSEQTTERNKCFMWLACFAYVLKSRFKGRIEAHGFFSWTISKVVYGCTLKCRYCCLLQK